jgi:hypothetical protein
MRVVSNSVAADARRSKSQAEKTDPKKQIPRCTRDDNDEEEFRSQKPEVRIQVRASRGLCGLLTAPLPADALLGSWPEPNGHGS